MNLVELQNSLQKAIMQAELTASQLKNFADNENTAERLAIYRDAYYLRLIGNLKSKYEVLQKYLGVAKFNKLMVEFLKQNPSQHYSIRFLGNVLPAFMRQYCPNDLIAADLAGFEWALCEVLFAEPQKALSLEALRNVSAERWPELIFRFHPSVALLQMNYPVDQLWSALQANKEGGLLQETALMKCNTVYLIWSKQGLSYYLTLDANEQKLFACIQQELQFSELCEVMSQSIAEDSVIAWVSQCLQHWINHELLIL